MGLKSYYFDSVETTSSQATLPSGPYDLVFYPLTPSTDIAIINRPQCSEGTGPLLLREFTKDAGSAKYSCLQCHTLFAQIP